MEALFRVPRASDELRRMPLSCEPLVVELGGVEPPCRALKLQRNYNDSLQYS